MLSKMAPNVIPPPPVEQREKRSPQSRSHTAVVQPVQLEEVRVAEVHPLADHIHEIRDPRYDCGFCSVFEGGFAVVHD